MTVTPGEYCMRCGAKSDVMENSEGQMAYMCPRGHGQQGLAPVAEPATPAEGELVIEEEQGEEEDEEDDEAPPRKPPPRKPATKAAKKKTAKKK